MADDERLSELANEVTTPTDTDRFITVDDIEGTPVSGWLSWANLKGGMIDYWISEYSEITDWLDDVTLGNDGLTSIPEVVLVPRAAALSDTQGGMYYSDIDDSIYVCTSDT